MSNAITVAEVAKEAKDAYSEMYNAQLRDELEDMGYDSRFSLSMTRDQLIAKLVDLEVYAFTH